MTFYVSKVTVKGRLVAYSLWNQVGGMESEETRFSISPNLSADQALAAAERRRDELNMRSPDI